MLKYEESMGPEDMQAIQKFLTAKGISEEEIKGFTVRRCKTGNYMFYNRSQNAVIDPNGRYLSGNITDDRISSKGKETWHATEHFLKCSLETLSLNAYIENISLEEKEDQYIVSLEPKPTVGLLFPKQVRIGRPQKKERFLACLDANRIIGINPEIPRKAKTAANEWIEEFRNRIPPRSVPDKLRDVLPNDLKELFKIAYGDLKFEFSHKIQKDGTVLFESTKSRIEVPFNPFTGTVGKAKYKGVTNFFSKMDSVILTYPGIERVMAKLSPDIRAELSLNLPKQQFRIVVRYKHSKKTFDVPCNEGNREENARNAEQAILEGQKEDEAVTKRIHDEIFGKVRRSAYYGDLLAAAVYDAIKRNDHLSMTKLTAIIRGKKTDLDNIKGSRYAGMFALVSDDDVEDTVHGLVFDEILKDITINGKYKEYTAYAVADKKYDLFDIFTESAQNGDYAQYSDADWLAEVRSGTFGPSGNAAKLDLLDHENVFCVEPEAAVSYFRDAPESVRAYLGIAAKTETGVRKKICKKVSDYLATLKSQPEPPAREECPVPDAAGQP